MGTGTGKTLTSLELSTYNPTHHLLVICPYSAIEQWKINIKTHFSKYSVVDFKKSWTSKKIDDYLRKLRFDEPTAIVINYDMIHRVDYIKNIVNNDWTIIADEIHRIKNYGTYTSPVKATHYLLDLGMKTIFKIGLTATPTQSEYGGYIDYYTQLKFLGYMDMSYNEFKKEYVVIEKEKIFGVPFPLERIKGYKNTDKIDSMLKNIARRYVPKYEDFEPQFNKVILERSKNYLKMCREKAYKKGDKLIVLNNSARSRVAKKTMTTGVVYGMDMLRNRHAIEDNTIKLDWLEDFLKDTEETVVVFYSYNVELDSLEKLARKLGKKYIIINGYTPNKYELVNNGGYNLVIGQFRAMSEALDGLHLKSHIEVFFSMPESSMIYTQAIGRIDRIGQTLVPMYYFLVMEKTLDEVIINNIENKIEFSERTLELLEVDDVFE